MLVMTPFEAFQMYIALKNHFTQKTYDFFKYNGKVKVTYSSFEKRKDKYFFSKLAKKKELTDYLLANFVDGEINQWVGDIVTDQQSDTIYTKWKARQESLTYKFKTDLSKLKEDFDYNIKVEDGQHPYLLILFMQNQICIETLIIIDMLTNCFKYWDKQIQEQVIWPNIKKKCERYRPFLSIDTKKYRKILVDLFNE